MTCSGVAVDMSYLGTKKSLRAFETISLRVTYLQRAGTPAFSSSCLGQTIRGLWRMRVQA